MRFLLLLLAAARLVGAQTAGAHSYIVATLPDSTFWPEGVDADPKTGRLYVASIGHRTIAEIKPDGSVRELLRRDRTDLGPIMGVRFDSARGVVWATTSGYKQIPESDSSAASLLEIRPSDGTIIHRWIVPRSANGNVLGDLAIGPRGDVYVSDSVQPAFYVLRSETDSLATIRSSLFRSLQGLAPTPDGKTLYLTDYSNGLLRVNLATSDVGRIADIPGSTTRGCDGIVLYHGAIIAVQNGTRTRRIIRFTLDESGESIARADVLDENTAIADEPTIGTVRNGEFIYVANSQWDKHNEKGERLTHEPLTPPVLLGLKIP